MKKSIDFHFESPEESLGYLLWQTSMQWQRQMNRALDEVGITHTQYVILIALAWLSRSSQQVTQMEIADHSNTDRMMVSKILRTLQKISGLTVKNIPPIRVPNVSFLPMKECVFFKKPLKLRPKPMMIFLEV